MILSLLLTTVLPMCSNSTVSSASAGITWHDAGASIYGGECGSGSTGYRGDDLNENPWSFAELGMGSAMGGLQNHTRIRMWSLDTGKRTWVIKRDIGEGGDPVGGFPRAIDLYYKVAQWLVGADCNWTGVIRWRKAEWFDAVKHRR